jgi:Mce-associated membrane protein
VTDHKTDDTRDSETTKTAKAVEGDPEATEKQDSPAPTKRPRRDRSRMLRNVKLVPVILIVLLLVSGAAAIWMYFKQYKPDQQTNPDVARAVVNAASDGTVALLSYSPESLDKDFAAAKSHLAGDFLSYYNQFTQEIVAPAAKQKSLKTTAHVMGAAVSELHSDSAVVLVFVDQSTTSKDKPDPSMAASNVLVSLTRVNGNWLITKFDPI